MMVLMISGLYDTDRKTQITEKSQLKLSFLCKKREMKSCISSFRCLGSAVLGLCYVACGRTDAYQCDGLYIWDAAAGTLIVREAGGYVVDSSGDHPFILSKIQFER